MGRSGSGLGLAVVYGVIHDHKGYVDVKTEVGQGSDFILYFPTTTASHMQADEQGQNWRGTETVLVVDDLAVQRELASKLLHSLGYQVATVEDGHAAVEYLQKQPADILVLDMIMADEFDGLDTYREIAKISPGQKAVIASGFSETERVKEAQELGAGVFVKKPYTLKSLGQAIRSELDQDTERHSS